MSKLLRFYILFIFISWVGNIFGDYTQKYSGNCMFYDDPFGPLQTGRTMGDLVRYTVTPNINLFNGLVKAPAGAQDVYNFGNNTDNLYNALGYLYAGWVSLNYRMPPATGSSAVNNPHNQFFQQNMNDVVRNWITAYRQSGTGLFGSNPQKALTDFDNNANCHRTLLFPMSTPLNYIYYTTYNAVTGDTDSAMTAVNTAQGGPLVSESCGWCPNQNSQMANSVLAVLDLKGNHYICPSGQFFGARLAHILGVIVNDVPWDGVAQTGGAASAKPAFKSPLIGGPDGQGTALPMFAVMSGGPWPVGAAPQKMIQTSTAHFESLQTFITKLSAPSSGWSLEQQYLRKHLLPTVSRLALVCSYGMSTNANSTNLIQINDDTVTSYDKGVVLAIQNNTEDTLLVNQIASGTIAKIGTLKAGINNHFLHTASLMSSIPAAGTTTTTSSDPVATNMISIVDTAAERNLNNTNYAKLKIATYIQVLNGAQLSLLSKAFNTLLQGGSYNQTQVAPTSFNSEYLVITNFDPTISSGSLSNLGYNDATVTYSYRMQVIDIAQFKNQPYFVTVQINKENLGYGLVTPQEIATITTAQINPGNSKISFLYPSITSCKLCTWQSIMHLKEALGSYSKIPLLMIPDVVWNSKINGLHAYYLIWLMSYVSALTECSYNGVAFGDRMAMYDKVFGLFSNQTQAGNLANIQSGYSSQTSRIVVDAQGNLVSGQVLKLDTTTSIMGCDTFDVGDGFNQDIPVLNLAVSGTDANGNPIPVANNTGASFVNLSATFGTKSSLTNSHGKTPAKTFSRAYGLPYSNIMMFSLPTQAITDGVDIAMAQLTANNYQLIITSTKDFTDINNNSVPAGSVLAAPQIFVDSELYTVSNIVFDFLHVNGSTAWNSPQSIGAEEVGKNLKFNLKYSQANLKNSLKIEIISKELDPKQKNKPKNKKNKPDGAKLIQKTPQAIQTVSPYQLQITNPAQLWLGVNINGQVYILMNNSSSGLNAAGYTLISSLIDKLQNITLAQFNQGIMFSLVEINNKVWVYAQYCPESQVGQGQYIASAQLPGLTKLPAQVTWSGSFLQPRAINSNNTYLFTGGTNWPANSTIPAYSTWAK